MKKLLLFLFLIPVITFGQTKIPIGQLDSANSVQSKVGLVAAYNNLKGWINLPTKVLSPYYYYPFGDSFTSGTGATLPSNRYANLDAAFLGVPFTNRGISGTGAYNVTGQAYSFDAYGSLASLQIGLNDVRLGASTTSALTLAKIGNGVNNVIAYHFIDSTFAAGSGTRVTTTGTWTTYNAQAVSGLSTSGLTASSSGATITAVTYGPTVVIGLIGTDGTIATYGSATITIDGTSYGTINENGQTDAITDGQGNNNSLMPFVKLYTGLSEGKHTVVLTTSSATQFVVDYFGQLKKPAQCFPMVVFDIAYVNSTGQATYPSMTNTNVNSANAVIASDIATFTALGYPVFHAYTNTYYICATDASAADNLHPSDKGHRHIFQAFYNAISSLQNPFVQQDLRSTATPAFQNVSLNALTQAGIVYDATGPVLATNATDFNYGSNTAGYLGLGVSGVNADSKFRVLDPTGAGLRIAYNATSVNYYDANTHNIRTGAGSTIAQLTSSGATFYESILPSTGSTYNLGSSGATFATGYINTLSATSVSVTGTGTYTVASLGASTSVANLLRNNTAAISGTPVQVSPYEEWDGQGYNTGTTTTQTLGFRAYAVPISGSPITGTFNIDANVNGSYNNVAKFTNAGGLTINSLTPLAGTSAVAPIVLTSGSDLTTVAAGSFEYNGTRLAFSPSTTRKRIPLYTDATPTSNYILVGNGTDFTLTAPTGTGSPVEAASPTLSGTPLTTTAAVGTNSTQIASTAYVIQHLLTTRTTQAINATATATAAQMAGGYITSTSAAATTITFQTATAFATQLGAAAGTTFDLYIDNTAGANTVTIVLGTGMTGVNSPSLTVSTGASGIALYHFTFSSTSACTVVRLQ